MEEKEINNIEQEKRCKKCNSLQTYVKLTTKERVCRSCGHVEKIEDNSKEKNEGEKNNGKK